MKVLLLDNWGEKAKEVLGEVAEVVYIYKHQEFNQEIKKQVRRNYPIDGIVTGLEWNNWDNNFIIENSLTPPKFIASCTTGLDHIDTEYCRDKGIKIISLQGETEFLQDVWATAEHTWALIMSLVRKIPFAHADVCAGNWERERWQGTELRGKTLGIVGYGRVGWQVARFAEVFGMRIANYDKYQSYGVRFEWLLQNSDIITAHVPLNNETRGMFGEKEFATMKPGAYFINTSRAPIVEPQALYNALDGKIAGVAIDVMEGYPNKYWEYLTEHAKEHNNLIITPHIAGNTAESREKTQLFIANKIKDFIQGGG